MHVCEKLRDRNKLAKHVDKMLICESFDSESNRVR